MKQSPGVVREYDRSLSLGTAKKAANCTRNWFLFN